MQHKFKIDTPLSESSVSHKLSEIQKRCRELLKQPDGLTGLTLEDGSETRPSDRTDPYNLRRPAAKSLRLD